MQPDPTNLLEIMSLDTPLIGFYDAPDSEPFNPLVTPKPERSACIFAYYQQWLAGKTLHLTKDNHGCGGAGHWLFGIETRSKEEYVEFLVDDEGLKASHELMGQWFDYHKGYQQEYPNILIGPLRADQYQYLKSVSFFVNPGQLSVLMLGAQYNNAPGEPAPVIAPFGSGCMELVTLFEDLTIPQALIGVTDIAMRQYLPADMLAFTVSKPMFEQLCGLDESSFLYKPFWKDLKKARRVTSSKVH